jgi:hypothetical protein
MFLDDLITKLTSAGLGVYGTSLFKGSKAVLPTGSGPLISVISTGGLEDEGTHNLSSETIAYERPSAQVICRATDAVDAEAASIAAAVALTFTNEFINGTWWRLCKPAQPPFELPPDAQNRVRYVFNVECVKRLSPATS